MSKLNEVLEVIFGNRTNPPPPPLPKYSVADEAAMWSWDRVRFNLPVDKGDIPYTPVGTQPDSPDKPDWRGVVKNQIRELPLPEPEIFGQPKEEHYFWFDTPDYADPFKKLWFATKTFVKGGIFTGLIVSCVTIHPEGNIAGIRRGLTAVSLPIIAGGLAASTVTITVANLRGNADDMYNYLPGGLVFGLITGYRHWRARTFIAIGAMAAGALFKHNAEINGQLVPRIPWRSSGYSISGYSAKSFSTGDLRFGLRDGYGDPGRDIRKY